MKKININNIKIPFECENHQTTQEVSPSDLVVCGVPLCETCNEEMSIENYVIVEDDQGSLSTHGKCQRCHGNTVSTTMSSFNTQMCCPNCINLESSHPEYEMAVNAEMKAVAGNNYNFPGIGLPEDYEEWAKRN